MGKFFVSQRSRNRVGSLSSSEGVLVITGKYLTKSIYDSSWTLASAPPLPKVMKSYSTDFAPKPTNKWSLFDS
ncbi:hypothetical protein PsorP6_008679 [Peronosclerospora sorghi]|uniref:Uncharacterized protein n=1 Tax=Peronosclerospora sorghi TaxID=230839 RepID=A0ACC0VZ48_9STRA|nr:hypothetical protein PsorP6_008679 [Peronosclerospora sorghi]